MMVYSKPKHVGAFVIYSNVNFNVLKQIYCALIGVIKDRTEYVSSNKSPTRGNNFFSSLS
jgi:hypothetical protein